MSIKKRKRIPQTSSAPIRRIRYSLSKTFIPRAMIPLLAPAAISTASFRMPITDNPPKTTIAIKICGRTFDIQFIPPHLSSFRVLSYHIPSNDSPLSHSPPMFHIYIYIYEYTVAMWMQHFKCCNNMVQHCIATSGILTTYQL